MDHYVLTSNLNHSPHGHGETYSGPLEQIKSQLVHEAHTYDRDFGHWSTWGLSVCDLEEGEHVPEVTADAVSAFASKIWDIHPNHITMFHFGLSVQEVIEQATETVHGAGERFSAEYIEEVVTAALDNLEIIAIKVAQAKVSITPFISQAQTWAQGAQRGDFATTITQDHDALRLEWLAGDAISAHVDIETILGRKHMDQIITAYRQGL